MSAGWELSSGEEVKNPAAPAPKVAVNNPALEAVGRIRNQTLQITFRSNCPGYPIRIRNAFLSSAPPS
tara:strand:+ start:48 stop:251 length:204 start_codon:yes stop_codon:yes gene_type:complete